MAFAACGGDSDSGATPTRVTSAFDRPLPSAQQAAVCDSRDAVGLASAWATALRPDTDAGQLAEQLQRAATEAPELLRDDFRTVVDAQLPFLRAIGRVKASGNLAKLTDDPEFQQGIASLGQPEVVTAIGEINRWYATHCTKPG